MTMISKPFTFLHRAFVRPVCTYDLLAIFVVIPLVLDTGLTALGV